jgi:hypothetical protein
MVTVAWLIAYGAMTEPRAPVEQLPHGDTAQRTLVSRLLTKHFTKLHRTTALATNILDKNILVFEQEIHNGLM